MASVAQSGTLVASTVTTVTLTNARGRIRVVNRGGTADIWFTIAGSGQTPAVPTVGGNDCYCAPGVAGASEVVEAPAAPVVVSLISSGTPTFTVEAEPPTTR